jgi:hypothetical protein
MAPDVIESAEGAVGVTYDRAYSTGDMEAVKRLDKARLETTLKRLSPDAVPNLHFGFFEDISRLEDQGVSELLAARLQAFRDSGTTVGSNAIGSLTGQEMQKKVDAALAAASPPDPNTGNRTAPTLSTFLPGRSTVVRTPEVQAQPAGSVIEPGSGEINIPHVPPPASPPAPGGQPPRDSGRFNPPGGSSTPI